MWFVVKNNSKRARRKKDRLFIKELAIVRVAMSNAANASDEKWTCEYCTYANYPSSLKCTMCKGKPSLLKEDIFQVVNDVDQLVSTSTKDCQPKTVSLDDINILANEVDEDIEKSGLRPTTTDAKGLSHLDPYDGISFNNDLMDFDSIHNNYRPSNESISTANQNKWRCSVCTYLNWPRAQRCSQCLRNREQSCIASANDDLLLAEQLKPLSIRSKSPASPVTAISIDNSAPSKWQCLHCTFENWPKSQKCSMCGSVRDNLDQTTNELDFTQALDKNAANNLDSADTIYCEGVQEGNNRQGGGTVSMGNFYSGSNTLSINNTIGYNNEEQRQNRLRSRRQADWQWLHACIGVVENNAAPVEAFIACGGSPSRTLTAAEVTLLNRSSAFEVGYTLIHLAIRFQREEMLPMLLAKISGSGSGIKRVPSYVAPDLAADIRRYFSSLLRIRKGGHFLCQYVNEHSTFAMPADIEELPAAVQEQLYEELLDKDAQQQLENPPPALNWSLEITDRLGSRLLVLWNRSAGDCLLDSVMQATWGIFDTDNVMRRVLAESLHQGAQFFYPRWKEYEMIQASLLHFTLEETQWEEDWRTLLALANQPGASLEQLHIFVLAHILRRPIIVYGVKYVKSFRGENLGFARFEGVYLPLLWEPSFCTRSPISLGYTRGHFSALVPTESYTRLEATNEDPLEDVTFLPLMDCNMKLMPIHFVKETEMGREEEMMREWMDVCCTESGLMVAQQKLYQRPLLVGQLVEEWLNHYRRLAQVFSAPFARQTLLTEWSDGDSDEE